MSSIYTPSHVHEAGKIWYVNASCQLIRDGQGWSTAFDSLQSALAQARPGDEVWVAKGSYYPDRSDRNISFELKEDVVVYGGFSGAETSIDQRDYRKNLTVLSGNIGSGDKTRNTITIIKGANNAILDGFTVCDAYSAGQATMHLVPSDITKNDMPVGGGMRNFKVAPIVRNCIFQNNYSPKGGAVYNVQDASAVQAQFVNVSFIDNTAQMRGGAVSNDLGAMPSFINCRFTGNRCEDKGGALYNDFAASPLFFNCLFQSNSAISAGAIGNDGGSAPLLVNVTITGNRADIGMGDDLYQGTGAQNNPVLINSVVDDIYNWHENVVATLNCKAPLDKTIMLEKFIAISNLKDGLEADDLHQSPQTKEGYQEDLDGAILLENQLIKKLITFYIKNGGAVDYRDAYSRPSLASDENIVYVAPDSGSAKQDGSSWGEAYTDLQSAIDKAALNKASVWIKAGTYAPSQKSSEIAAFILYDDVKLYGGFDGSEKSPDDRDINKNPTILSAKTLDGAYRFPHVLYGADNTVLDGLTLRDGKADGFTYNGKGGGLLAYHAGETYKPLKNDPAVGFSMRIANCRFVDNQALEGGAIYAFSKAKLAISDTRFENNSAVYGGAIMDREGNTITCDRCSFVANQASVDGGAVYEDYGSHASYTETHFENNRAGHEGGAVFAISRASQLEATMVSIEKCTFNGNDAPTGASISNTDTSSVTIKNSTFDNNLANLRGVLSLL